MHVIAFTSSELYHHGIKGQKWGQRNGPPYPLEDRGNFMGQDRNSDIRIKKGTEAYRVQSQADDGENGMRYVTFRTLDNATYLGVGANRAGVAVNAEINEAGDAKPYNATLELTEDVIMPAYETSVDSFIKTMGNFKIKDIKEDLKYADKTRANQKKFDEFIDNCKHMKVTEARDAAYSYFVQQLMTDSKARKIFFDDLKAQGYNAIIDENDTKAGSNNQFSKTATIIFDRDKTTKTTSVSQLSDEDARYLGEMYRTNDTYNPYAVNEKSSTSAKWEKYTNWSNSDEYKEFTEREKALSSK